MRRSMHAKKYTSMTLHNAHPVVTDRVFVRGCTQPGPGAPSNRRLLTASGTFQRASWVGGALTGGAKGSNRSSYPAHPIPNPPPFPSMGASLDATLR